ncbi:Peptide chain release factor RF1 [Buchnera aphidicola (Tetraneura ulmi)]|uniref:peptide chain release factor 1 n=1 Tax=Buchnera aphidicola TaxID=9 RepID=UPI003463CB61
MKDSIFIKLQSLYERRLKLEFLLSNKNIFSNQVKYLSLSKEYLLLLDITNYFISWKKEKKNIKESKVLLSDSEIKELAKEEIFYSKNKLIELEKKINLLLLPQDPNDKLSCFIEIRAATGGEEASIFAKELFRMYTRYSEKKKWEFKTINFHQSECGGYREIVAKIQGKNVCGRLKFESGGHRVQRVPKTESQGRIHTSTCTVAIMPELSVVKKSKININDLKIDTFRSSGAGGQHVNTTDSAIRITHIPTGQVVECQDERSQHKNKSKALSVLSDRIYSAELLDLHKKESSIRKNLLGSGDRSDRIRTYNFPQNRITDHRINLTLHKLDKVLEGNLDILIENLIKENRAEQLSCISESDS